MCSITALLNNVLEAALGGGVSYRLVSAPLLQEKFVFLNLMLHFYVPHI